MSDLKTSVDPNPPDLDRLLESATYCRVGDEKRPDLASLPDFSTYQACPEDPEEPAPDEGVAEGAPPSWFVRVVFDKLLDPDVEELVPLDDTMPDGVQQGTFKNTQPVTLTCGGLDIAYDGYYVPNGNRISWPLGPALFVAPLNPLDVQTGASCEVGIKDIVQNKSGESVPMDQRSFAFKIAPMELRFSDPDPSDGAPGEIELDPQSPVQFFWTAAFTMMPVPAEIKIFEAPNLNATTGNGDPDLSVCDAGGTAVVSTDIETSQAGTGPATTALIMNLNLKNQMPDLKWKAKTTYRIEFGPNAKITPEQGGADGTFPGPTEYKLCFHTTAAP